MVPIKYNVRNLIVRKSTTAAAAFGLALTVFIFAGSLMVVNGLKKTLGRGASPDVAVVLRKGSDAELTSSIEDKHVNLVLAQAQQIGASKKPAGVGEVVVVILLDKMGTDGVSNVTVRGVSDEVMAFRPTAKIIDGRAAAVGTDEVIVGKAIRNRFKGLEIGQSFEMKKNRSVKVVGVFDDGGSSFESEVWADVHTVRQTFGREGYVSSIRVRLDSPAKYHAFEALVEGDRQLGLVAMREPDYFEKQSEATSFILGLTGGLIAVFFAIGGMIGATITMNAQVANRTREIGTLRALGFSRASVLFSFLLESIVLALAGGSIGAVCSLAMGFVKVPIINQGSWSEIVFGFEPTWGIILGSLFFAVGMGVIGGFLPAWRAARVAPVEAMRG